MKVVINNCFGGFSLSPKATKRLAELQGKQCFFYKGGLSTPFVKVEMDDIQERSFFWAAFTTDNVDELNKMMGEMDRSWHTMTDIQKDEWNKKYYELNLTSRPEDRTDKLLIQVIEELGEEADGECAQLKIVEIPDGVDYEISEYDGNEHIAEKHRTWG